MPQIVKNGLTLAIAEPSFGSSYHGDPEVQAAGSSSWVPMERNWASVFTIDDGTFASGGPGGVLRITSAQDEGIEALLFSGECFRAHANRLTTVQLRSQTIVTDP